MMAVILRRRAPPAPPDGHQLLLAPGTSSNRSRRRTISRGVTGTTRCSCPANRSVLGDVARKRPRAQSISPHFNRCVSDGVLKPASLASPTSSRHSESGHAASRRSVSSGVTYRVFRVGVTPPLRWANGERTSSSRRTASEKIVLAFPTWVFVAASDRPCALRSSRQWAAWFGVTSCRGRASPKYPRSLALVCSSLRRLSGFRSSRDSAKASSHPPPSGRAGA